MELWQIELAIRKQCLLNHESNRRLQTDQAVEMRGELGMILFVGVSALYGFDGEEVLNYIDIDPAIYKKRKATFIRAHQEIQQRIATGSPTVFDFKNKIYVKTAMVQGYIENHFNTQGYLSYKTILKGSTA